MNFLLDILDYGPPLLLALIASSIFGTIWYFYERHQLAKEEREKQARLAYDAYVARMRSEWQEKGYDAWLEAWEEQEQERER